jgi:hypothetical protein
VNDVTPGRARADVEARVARRLAALLDDAGGPLEATVSARLRFAREQALARVSAARRVAALAPETVGAGQLALAGLPAGLERSERWFRWSTLIPLLLLVVGLLAVQEWHLHTQITAAAEVDLALLGDDLPPSAYSDPGFVEFLKQPKEWRDE